MLNAALALKVAGIAQGDTFEAAISDGINRARNTLQSCAAWEKLEALVAFLQA